MANTSSIRIQRAGVAFDIPKETVRRVCACNLVTAVGSHGAYSSELEGLPALILEPSVLAASTPGGAAMPPAAAFPPPRFAVLLGDSADMPVAIAADHVDAWSDPTAGTIVLSADKIHTSLFHPFQKTFA